MIMHDGSTPTPDKTSASMETWRRLYDAATRVRALEPWLWMEETDIFGVQDLEKNEVLFVSVMGLLGEYHAIAVYPGINTVTEFWRMQERSTSGQDLGDTLLGIYHLHAAFGKKGDLEMEDKRIARELKLDFKGPVSWPYFRSHRPGYIPWMIEADEARRLLLALEQLLDIAPRVKNDRRLVARKPGTYTYLVRAQKKQGAETTWVDERRECLPEARSLHLEIPGQLVNAVRALPKSKLTVEMDVFPSCMPIGKRGERMERPYMIMAVDTASYFILGVEFIAVETTFENMWTKVPAKLLEMLNKHKMRPERIVLKTEWLCMVMDAICRDLGIELCRSSELPALTEARRDIEQQFSRR